MQAVLLSWASLLGPALAAVIAVAGWFVLHRFNVRRDRDNKRRELIIAYLLEAYRRMEAAANREDKTEDQAIAFESALADIQLLGTPDQFAATMEYIEGHGGGGDGQVGIGRVLALLRDDLRRELGLVPLISPPRFFRFEREWGSGDWQGNAVPSTPPVRGGHRYTK